MKREDFKPGMIVEFEKGQYGLCMESEGGLSIIARGEYSPIKNYIDSAGNFITRYVGGKIIKVYAQTHNRHISQFIFGGLDFSELRVIYDATKENVEKKKLDKVITDLQKQIAEAQKKLAEMK